MSETDDRRRPLNMDELTWTALLGHWIEFARSAVGLPDNDEGRRMRESVADIIMLQAVWFALRDLGDLPHDEKMLGLDRAEVLIDKHGGLLQGRWGESMPSKLNELVTDASAQLSGAIEANQGDQVDQREPSDGGSCS